MGLPLWARAGASFFFALCAGGRAGCLPQKAAKGTHGAVPRGFFVFACRGGAAARFPAGRLRGSGAGPEAAPGRAL